MKHCIQASPVKWSLVTTASWFFIPKEISQEFFTCAVLSWGEVPPQVLTQR